VKNKEYTFKLITPIFSYGADNRKHAESAIRTTSIKGMMRYMFRIAQPMLSSKELFDLENKLFGDAKDQTSPVRLAITFPPNAEIKPSQFLLHKPKGEKKPIIPRETFKVRMSLRPNLKCPSELNKKQNENLNEEELLNWYQSLLELSFLLIGLGQRSRKGRGCAWNSEKKIMNINEVKNEILCYLNKINVDKNKIYKFDDEDKKNKINLCVESVHKRPFIEKVEFGKAVKKQKSKEAWEVLLKKIDWTSHDIKERDQQKKLKHASRSENGKYYSATGSGTPRFSSSIIVSAVETTDGLLPIYTCVKAVVKNDVLDAKKEWQTFISKIEGNGGGGS